MRKGTAKQLIEELTYKIEELKDANQANSSAVIVDDEEDVIMADEDIEVEEVKEEIPVDVVEAPEDESEYFTGLYVNIEKELKDLTDSVAWSTDEDNVYLDVNFEDGHVFTFTIPKADLTHDVQQLDKDIEYVCTAVRDSQPTAETEDFEDTSVTL